MVDIGEGPVSPHQAVAKLLIVPRIAEVFRAAMKIVTHLGCGQAGKL